MLKPEFLVFLDGSYFLNEEDIHEVHQKNITNIILKTTWDLILFLPYLARHSKFLNKIPQKNKKVKIKYFNYTILEGFSLLKYQLFKWNLGMPQCQNVIASSVFIAINMGFKKIYLTGVESSFFKNIIVDEKNEVYLEHLHFYSKEGEKNTYRLTADPRTHKSTDMAGALMLAVKTFRSYINIQKYAKYRGVKIYNTTMNSYIDAFEKIRIF